MQKIIIDTNFLLIPVQFKVDIFREIDRISGKYKLFVIDKTTKELDDIIARGGKDKMPANVAKMILLQKLEKGEIEVIKSDDNTYVDDVIVNECEKDKEIYVATNDVQLIKRLRQLDIKIIQLRQKNFLDVK